MTSENVCPLAVNETEWKLFVKTYHSRFEKVLKFYKSKSSHQFIVHKSDENVYTFRCLATKHLTLVSLPFSAPLKPNVFLMRNLGIVEETIFS